MDPAEAAYTQMMERFWRMGVQDGLIAATTTPEEFFGFTAMDIECVHRRLAGFGAGTWFRLQRWPGFRLVRPAVYDDAFHLRRDNSLNIMAIFSLPATLGALLDRASRTGFAF